MTSEQVPHPAVTHAVAKRALRREVLAARRALDPTAARRAAVRVADHLLATPELGAAQVVAAYVSVGTEPGTGPLLERLHAAGTTVLLPVLLADGDLDWAPYDGPDSLAPADRGLLEPRTTRLGPDAVADADVVVVPGVAVSATGHRLGRGGGSYDRALARVGPATFTCLLLYDGELDRPVPVEPHDVPVSAAVTPSGLVRYRVTPATACEE